MYQNIHEIARS